MKLLLIKDFLIDYGILPYWASILRAVILVLGIVIFCWLINFLSKKIIIRIVAYYVRKSKTQWDDIFLEKGVFNRLSHIIPAIIIYYSAARVFLDFPQFISFFKAASYIYIISISLMVANSFINAMHEIYLSLPVSAHRHIKGYVQVVKIILFFIGGIIILSVLLGESPYALLAGLGAMAAVIIIVFRDAILGLSASIQLSENKMLKPGDYIIIAKDNIEGTVKEISLSSVKILNPDNTYNYIPAYSLVSQPFSNWIGVKEAGARRIKRSVNIDIRTIRFCSENLLKKLKDVDVLQPFLATYLPVNKANELPALSQIPETNIGFFRKYIEFYLKKHPNIDLNNDFVIHQLQPTNTGLPLEIYFFINELDWEKAETIQSEIVEHLLAIMREFDLSPYQSNI